MRFRPSALFRYGIPAHESERFPLDWERLFGRRAPLAVEVGFGGGEYLAWWAGQRPDWNLVGLERPPECVARAARLLERSGADHVRLVRGDARYLLRELFAAASLERVLMQFPMPWPKEKQAKHRVSSPDFAATLAMVLRPGGCFELVTDQDWYATESHDFLSGDGRFELSALEREPEREFRTRYEQKWLEQGRSIYRLRARLLEGGATRRIIQEDRLHCTHLDSTLTEAAVAALAGRRFTAPGVVAEVKESFRAEGSWLLKVVSADDAFSQIFYLRLVSKPDGSSLVKVEPQPRPYPTAAVRFVVESVAAALRDSLAPGADLSA
ncbi:MAG: tRNA (guanosine(46)-N7)-methyltransferase TrmB [Planctomycetes bacterium]|nr:tRNA (guanosine(46)-N7)-methyltransferase TrmB [Planctomycetota bacterium]